jgi:proliferating cell nuclear antigen
MFQSKLKSETLKGVVDVVSTLIDEAKFKIDANGVSLRAVDPAHVAMIDLHLDKAAFEQYSATDTELGIDLDKLRDVLRLSKAGDLIEMRQDEERSRLVISVGNITRRMNLVSTEGMSDPKVPNLDLPAKISVNIEELQRGIKAAESISDHISLNANAEGFEMVSEGDTDLVSLKLPKDLLVSLDCKENIRSLFPMDYFSNIIRAIPNGTVV